MSRNELHLTATQLTPTQQPTFLICIDPGMEYILHCDTEYDPMPDVMRLFFKEVDYAPDLLTDGNHTQYFTWLIKNNFTALSEHIMSFDSDTNHHKDASIKDIVRLQTTADQLTKEVSS